MWRGLWEPDNSLFLINNPLHFLFISKEVLAVLGWIFQANPILPDQESYLCIPVVLPLEYWWRQQMKPREFVKKWDFGTTWLFPLKYGLMQLHFDKTSVCVIQEELKVFLFLSRFSCKPLQCSNIHHFPLFLAALNDKLQQMAVTDIQTELQMQIRCSSGNPQARILFSAHWGEQGAARGHSGPKEPQFTPRHLQMCTVTGTLCRRHSSYKLIISGCKLAGAQSTAPPQMPKCDRVTWFLEKADAGRWG